MRPGAAPVELVAPRPVKVAQRLVRFCPDEIAVLFLVPRANQLFELFVRQLILRVVSSLRGRLRTPECIRDAKLNPASISLRKRSSVDAVVNLMRARVRAFGISAFGLRLKLRILGLLRDALKEEEEKSGE